MSFFPPTPFTRITFPDSGYRGCVHFENAGLMELQYSKEVYKEATKSFVAELIKDPRNAFQEQEEDGIVIHIHQTPRDDLQVFANFSQQYFKFNHMEVDQRDFDSLKEVSNRLFSKRKLEPLVYSRPPFRNLFLDIVCPFEAVSIYKSTEYRTTAFQETWNWYMRSIL